MMTFEETRILRYLGTRALTTVEEVVRMCLPGGSREEAARVLWDLEWLGYVVRYGFDAVQITQRGRSAS